MRVAAIAVLMLLAVALPAVADTPPPPQPPAAKAPAVDLLASISSTGSGSAETGYGDLVADAVRASASADVAAVPADDLVDVTLPAGSVPVADMVKGLRYPSDAGETIVVLTVTGKQLKALAVRSLAQSPTAFPGFLQISGMTIRPGADPKSFDIAVGSSAAGDDTTYRLATLKSVADGSFGYFRALGGLTGQDTAVTSGDALEHFLQAHPSVLPPQLDRIQVQ